MSERKSKCEENMDNDSGCGGIVKAFLEAESRANESKARAEVEEATAKKFLDLGRREDYLEHRNRANDLREEVNRATKVKQGFQFFLENLDDCEEDWESIEALKKRIMNGESPLSCILKEPILKSIKLKPVRADECYNPEELRLGMEIESEHTPDPRLQKIITKHHLEEFPDDYNKELIKMEKRLELKKETRK